MYVALDPLPNKPWLCKHEAIVQASSIFRLQTLSIWTRAVFSILVNSLKHCIFMKCVQLIKKNCYQTSINIKPNISLLCIYPVLPSSVHVCIYFEWFPLWLFLELDFFLWNIVLEVSGPFYSLITRNYATDFNMNFLDVSLLL